MNQIDDWSGEFSFLRNDFPVSILFDGITYPSVEHAFQAGKTFNQNIRENIADAPTASIAKKIGKAITDIPDNWDSYRLEHMENILYQKFEAPELAKQLEDTGDKHIIMLNNSDTFWGMVIDEDDYRVGDNNLGKILMKIRSDRTNSRAHEIVNDISKLIEDFEKLYHEAKCIFNKIKNG